MLEQEHLIHNLLLLLLLALCGGYYFKAKFRKISLFVIMAFFVLMTYSAAFIGPLHHSFVADNLQQDQSNAHSCCILQFDIAAPIFTAKPAAKFTGDSYQLINISESKIETTTFSNKSPPSFI